MTDRSRIAQHYQRNEISREDAWAQLGALRTFAAEDGLVLTTRVAFIRPDNLSRQNFVATVKEVADGFSPLSPYRHQRQLFKIEKGKEG